MITVLQLRKETIVGANYLAVGMVRKFPPGKNSEQKNAGICRALADFPDDGTHRLGDVFGSIPARYVVGADQQNDHLGLDIFELTVLDAPQHMLRAVAGDAEILGFHGHEAGLPEIGSIADPTFCDGVSKKEHIDIPLARSGDISVMLRHPVLIFRFWHGRGSARRSASSGLGGS